MRILLIGATGYVGSRLLAETLQRGHEVTAVAKDADKLPVHPNVMAVGLDVTDRSALSKIVSGHDVVISAFNPALDEDGSGTQSIIDGVKQGGVARFLAVGGAGTLLLPSGERVIDQPDFPAEWKEGAQRTARFLEQLSAERELDWVFLSPAAMLAPGTRTGTYRVGKDYLLVDANGESRISLEDYAVAMLDEAEHPRHSRERFTVAY